MKRRMVVLVPLLTILVAAAPASAAPDRLEGLAEQLVSLGIDPTTVTIQDGLRNYAGPNCPGKGWDCVVPSGPIVQAAPPKGDNQFECVATPGTATPGPQSCTVVQTGSPGVANVAECTIHSTLAAVEQTCSITQTSDTSNTATVDMDATQRAGVDQSATQTATVTQTGTGSATNSLTGLQSIAQSSESKIAAAALVQDQDATQTFTVAQDAEDGASSIDVDQRVESRSSELKGTVVTASQAQDVHQTATIDQESTGLGAQTLDLDETQSLKAEAKTTGAITQEQNAGSLDENADAFVRQFADDGNIDTTINQSMSLDQEAVSSAAGAITQTQGIADGGGLRTDIDGDSANGTASYAVTQSKVPWTQEGSTGGTKVQAQLDQLRCCIFGTGTTYEFGDLTQTAHTFSDEGATQVNELEGRMICSVECTLTQEIRNNTDTQQHTETGTFVENEINCEPECTEQGSGATAAGTGLRHRDSGDIAITAVPPGATVSQATLVWGLLYTGETPPGTITFEDQALSGQSLGVSEFLCWGDTDTIAYLADVTDLVTGNGTYTVSDALNSTMREDDNPTPDTPGEGEELVITNGATLFVFFRAPGIDHQIITRFAYDTNTDEDQQIVRTFNGISSVGGPADLWLAGSDGQTNGSELITVGGGATVDLSDSLDGSDPQSGPSFSIGNLWDTDGHDVSAALPSGQPDLSVTVNGSASEEVPKDCVGLPAAVLVVSQIPPEDPPVD